MLVWRHFELDSRIFCRAVRRRNVTADTSSAFRAAGKHQNLVYADHSAVPIILRTEREAALGTCLSVRNRALFYRIVEVELSSYLADLPRSKS
jgi:hypothetical protein